MKRFLLLLAFLCSTMCGIAQQSISGRIISATGDTPLGGSLVKIKNTHIATIADQRGDFTLETPLDSLTLEVSLIGYRTKEVSVQLPLDNPLLIALEQQSSTLEKVIVSTGYQDIPKARATGSFTHINNERLNEQVSGDILSRLEAITNSLSVDRKTSINGDEKMTIRGISTFLGPSAPLIIVDNFPYHGDIDNINPNDVQDITVLKDAAAASIWGARSGNGVIVINTKQGRYNQPLKIEFNSNLMLTEKPDLSYIRQMSSSDFIDVELFLYEKGYYEGDINSNSKPPLSPVVELLLQRDEGTISAAEATAEINKLRGFDIRDDFSNYMYRQAVHQQYYLSLRGGAQNFNWIFSGGYDRDIGNLDAASDRISLRFQNSIKVTPSLTLSGGLNYRLTRTKSGRPGYGDIRFGGMYLPPYTRFADEGGKSLAVAAEHRLSYLQTIDEELLDWHYYPVNDYQYSVATGNVQDIVANFDVHYDLIDGLAAGLKYRYERQGTTDETLHKEKSYFARNLVNLFTQIDTETGEVTYNIPPGGIMDSSNETLQGHNLRGQLSFNKNWVRHEIAAIAGSEIQQKGTTSKSSRFYGFDENTWLTDRVDYVNRHPTYVTGRNSSIDRKDGAHSTLYRFVSFYGNAAYTYDQKYTLSVSGRRDASNIFGVKANDKWRPLWSAGVAWRISKEKFYKFTSVPYLKLRLTYGFSGNVDLSRSAVLTTRGFTVSPYTHVASRRIANLPNPELRWEKVRTINIGIDFETRNNRLRGSLELWQKSGTDLYGDVPMDYTTIPAFGHTKNVASMRGQGVDLELNTLNLNGDIQWLTHLNFSYYKDKVTNYYLESQEGRLFVSGFGITGVEGKPVNGLFGFKWAGLDPQTGDPRGYFNGEISKNYDNLTRSVLVSDLEYIGPGLPSVYGSLGNTFNWKNLSFTFRLSYKLGYYFKRSYLDYRSLFRMGDNHSDFAKRWKHPGDELHTNVPSMVYPAVSRRKSFYGGAEVNVLPADHIRFEYMRLSYHLPFLKKRDRASQVTVYANVQNIGLVWRKNKEGLDPERHSPLLQTRSIALGIRGRL